MNGLFPEYLRALGYWSPLRPTNNPSNQTQPILGKIAAHRQKQSLLGKDREGLGGAWRFGTRHASLRKSHWHDFRFSCVLARHYRWNLLETIHSQTCSAANPTHQSFLILVGVFFGFWVATLLIRRHAAIPRKFIHARNCTKRLR